MIAKSEVSAVEGIGLVAQFGAFRAIDHASISVPVGQRRALIGPNGAGKTTMLHLLAGQLRPHSGSVSLLGQDVTRKPAYKRAQMGLGRTFQITNLLQDLTVRENVQLALATDKARRVFWRTLDSTSRLREQSDGVLAEWDFVKDGETRVSELSYGKQRILEIILAMCRQPKVLLLDEPTAGLALADAQRLTELVSSLPRSITIVMIEHDMEVAFALADQVTVLHQGKVLAEGDPTAIAQDDRVLEVYLGVEEHE